MHSLSPHPKGPKLADTHTSWPTQTAAPEVMPRQSGLPGGSEGPERTPFFMMSHGMSVATVQWLDFINTTSFPRSMISLGSSMNA